MHCPASGIRGTVYPVVYGKSGFFILFHNVVIMAAYTHAQEWRGAFYLERFPDSYSN